MRSHSLQNSLAGGARARQLGTFARCFGAAIAAMLALAIWAPSAAHASGCTDSWTNTAGGSWSTAANWSKKSVPVAGEEACITAEGTYTVTLEPTLSSSVSLKSLTIGASSGTQKLTLASICSSAMQLSTSEGLGIGAHGALLDTATSCGYETVLSGPITNAGAVTFEPGGGGERTITGNLTNTGTVTVVGAASFKGSSTTLANEGKLSLGEGATLSIGSGDTFSNATGGSIVATGTGHVSVPGGAKFSEGAGTTSGSQPVIMEAGSLAYVSGGGESKVRVRGASSLTGNVGSTQSLVIEQGCSFNTTATAASSFTNAGAITVTGTACGYYSNLQITSGTLTNTGSLTVEPGGGSGERGLEGNLVNKGTVSIDTPSSTFDAKSTTFTNEGALRVEEGDRMYVASGDSLKNLTGGSIAATGSGNVTVSSGAAFTEGAGTTSGNQPVIVESGSLAYASGNGESKVRLRGTSTLSGSIGSAQSLVVEQGCSFDTVATAAAGFTNAGSIVLTGAGCGYYANLVISSGTLTNTGSITAEPGTGGASGARNLEGSILNKGTVSIQTNNSSFNGSGSTFTNEGALQIGEGDELEASGGSAVVNGVGGSISAGASGLLYMYGTGFTEGAGTTSGTEPVIVYAGSLAYVAGNGTSKVRLRESNSLSGSIGSAQSLVVEQGCSFDTVATAAAGFTNAGSIVLTGAGCGYYSNLLLGSNTLTNTGTITVEEGTGGASGERKIEGNLVNDRLLSVHAPTSLKVTGAFTQGETGTLDAQIASTSSYGSITAGGAATLAGSLAIEPIEAFKGAKGNKFTTVSAASRTGAFQHVLGATISPDLYYSPIYTASGATLEVLEGEPPEKVPTVMTKPTISGHAQQGQTLVASAGTWAHEPVEYTYQWLRCEESGAGCKAIAGASGQDYLLQGADASHKITVQVVAYNAAGESLPAEPTTPTAVVTGLNLHAAPGEDVSGIEGVSVTLDGSASTPASEISKYRWRFGDGSEAEGAGDAVLHHTYAAAGKYTASLTVFRGGEESTASTLVTIAAKPKPAEGAQITVQGSGNAPIAGATVLYVGSGGTRVEGLTGASGEAVLKGLPEGSDTVYVYKSGLRPAEASVTIDNEGDGSKKVTLESGEIATAELKSHELNYEEIIKAGINPSDPANQNVYEFVIKLAFIESPTPPVEVHGYVNSGGSFVGSYGASGGGGGGWSCSAGGCESGGGGGGGEERIVAQPEVVEGHPLIQWLILHGKAAVLKQFFEVSMIVQNLSPEPFELTKGTATLNLPAGLSLAPTAQPQSLSEAVPAIPGDGSDTTNWIIRGDQPGEYNLSANYKSTLEPFAAPVEVLAALANPLKVWGKEALSLKVKADEGKLYPGVPYHVYVGITNKANVPLYNVALSIDEEPHEHFIFQPQQQFSELLGELKPEQTIFVKYPYILVPDGESQSIFNPALSSATFDGEVEHPGENIEAVPAPPTYSLQAKTDTPGLVHLQWEAVPGAEGYEVFSTPTLDTPFGKEPASVLESPESPSEVKLLPASATKAYLKSTGESLHALSALIDGRPTLASPVVQGVAQLAPEVGRCTKVEKGKGKYGSSKCTALGGKEEYEWSPGAVKSAVKLTGAAAKLETVGHTVVSCKALSGGGSHATSKAIEGLNITFTGCEAAGKACTSSAAAAGEVRASTLTADLQWQSESAHTVALDIFRIGGSTLLSFECAGKSYEVKGSVLVPLKTGKMVAAEALKYKASKGKQALSEYETPEATKVKDFLETSIAGGAFEQTGLTATLTLTSEEPLEINTAV